MYSTGFPDQAGQLSPQAPGNGYPQAVIYQEHDIELLKSGKIFQFNQLKFKWLQTLRPFLTEHFKHDMLI